MSTVATRGLVGLILIALALAALPTASAHVDPISPDVGHAIVGDPLFDFTGSDGVLFGVNVDDPTQMASTTKSFTLFLAVIALEDQVVHATDTVTVGPNAVIGSPWVPPGSSLMNGTCCSPQPSLQVGEEVQFWDLLHGMMYPSGNDAAVAVGEFVIQGYVGPSGDVSEFVDRMNFAAFLMGLTNTHFTNPAGLDGDPSGNGAIHQTTPRDQARWWAIAIQHDLFRSVVGLTGNYAFTTTYGRTTKSYAYNWGFGYPGWEGHKGGDTSGCSGPKETPANLYACNVMSVRRLGRELVTSYMQGKSSDTFPGGGQAPLFDYGFAKLFHPDFRAESDPWLSVQDQALACTSGGRAVSAAVRIGHPVKLILWGADIDNDAITKLAESAELIRGPGFHLGGAIPEPPGDTSDDPSAARPPGPGPGPGPSPPGKGAAQKPAVRQVALAQLPGGEFITAVRTGGDVQLTWWHISPANVITKVAGGYHAGPANSVALQPVHDDTILLATKAPNGTLVMQTWSLGGRTVPGLFLRDTLYDSDFPYSEVSLTGLGLGQVDAANGHRAFTVATTTDDRNVQQAWGVDAGTGAISLMGTYFYGSTAKGVATSPVRVEPLDASDLTPPSFYVHAVRFQGTVHLFTTYLDDAGSPHPSGPGLDLGQDLTNLRVRDFGTSGLLVVGRDGNGVSTMFVIETRRSAEQTVVPYVISYHTSFAGTDFELCREATAHAEGDFFLARQAATTHALQLSAYRIGDRPY